MTVRERVLACRLIEKINYHSEYARQIGLRGALVVAKNSLIADKEPERREEKNNA